MNQQPTVIPVKMDWDAFEEKYNPQQNHIDDNASIGDGWGYETYGPELDYVHQINQTEPNRVWTVLDVDGCTVISSGYSHVNRMCYVITELPWADNENITVIESDDEEMYFHYWRVQDPGGAWLPTGYNSKGIPDLKGEWEDYAEKFADLPGGQELVDIEDISEYEFEEYLTKKGYKLEHSPEPFPEEDSL